VQKLDKVGLQSLSTLTSCMLIMALLVVSLGAYTRLKDAGLGCPDWPGCYGKWIVSATIIDPFTAARDFEEDSAFQQFFPIGYGPEASLKVIKEKAWIEMIHRYAAGLLGLGILAIAFLSAKVRVSRFGLSAWLPWGLVALLCFQAALGMWTVTLRLYPIVVMGHLLGGVLITMGLAWWFFSIRKQGEAIVVPRLYSAYPTLRSGVLLSIGVLMIQLILGGWTSANYAALVCLDFPLCQGLYNPPSAWAEAFNFLKAGNPGSPGIPLSFLARATVHMAHRYWALVTIVILLWTGSRLWKAGFSRRWLMLILALLCLQVGLGVTNILAYLPLSTAWLHHLVAILLLLSWLKVLRAC
jgi:cytochrome c oxidase assembly protein subunit 15